MTFSSFKSRLSDKEGAYTIEFLATLVAVIVVLVLVFQLLLLLINAVVFNNALQAAGQEASVQGDYNTAVKGSWQGLLTAPMLNGPTGSTVGGAGSATLSCPAPCVEPVDGQRGREKTKFGELITLQATYAAPSPFLQMFGGPASVTFNKTVQVPSQSAKELP